MACIISADADPQPDQEESQLLLSPKHGFVFLANSKCASTSIEAAFRPHAEIALRGFNFKHLHYRGFDRYLAPLLESRNYQRTDYEVVCLFREPIDWLGSWWRYRSRESLGESARHSAKSTVGVSFGEFVNAYIDRSAKYATLGRQSRFVRDDRGTIAVDRIYRLDDIDKLLEYLTLKTGKQPKVKQKNVSPAKPMELSDADRARITDHLADEYDIWNNWTVGHGKHAPSYDL